MQNKRGQGLSTNAIILIVLGIILLVVLVLGFTLGWKSILPFLSSDNVGSIATQCNIACSSSSVYDFCSKPLVLESDDLPDGQKEVSGNCSYFATTTEYQKYGIADCENLCS